jgi:hypothetical protein
VESREVGGGLGVGVREGILGRPGHRIGSKSVAPTPESTPAIRLNPWEKRG